MLDQPTWYHGSQRPLASLRAGSTVTPARHLAEVFSHRPRLVSMGDDGALRHDGRTPGYLHVVAEPVGPEDVRPHPRSTFPPGLEWLTSRELRLALVGPTEPDLAELLTPDEVRELERRLAAAEGASEERR